MHSMTADVLLDAWEAGLVASPTGRALYPLERCGAGTPEELQRLPIGRRDALLLELHELTFGPNLDCVTECPRCTAAVEARFSAHALRVTPAPGAERGAFDWEGARIEFRLPDSRDLMEVAHSGDVDEAHRQLLMRCVSS